MEGLNIDNIMSEEEINNLFAEDSDQQETIQDSSPDKGENKEATEELNVESLFEVTSESVGSEERQEGEDTTSEKKTGSSPNNNFYSSVTKAFKEDGVLPDLDDETINNVQGPEDLLRIMEDYLSSRLDEKQKRVDEALNSGVESDTIRQYENTLAYLDNITEETLTAETDEGENLRKNLIYQDLINRGYSKEDAIEELKEIFENGSDVRRAKRALTGNKDFFKKSYQKILDEAKEEKEREEKDRKQMADTLKKSILEDKQVFGDLQLDKSTRQRVFDSISKPVYKDKETGELYTALQKYEKENKVDFLKNVGLIFTLTDGFKNLDGLVKTKVNKEVKKGLRELEHTLNNTSRTSAGNLNFVSGVSEDPDAFIGKNWDLDV